MSLEAQEALPPYDPLQVFDRFVEEGRQNVRRIDAHRQDYRPRDLAELSTLLAESQSILSKFDQAADAYTQELPSPELAQALDKLRRDTSRFLAGMIGIRTSQFRPRR